MTEDTKKSKSQIDFEDSQNEMAGRDTGRRERFVFGEEREKIKEGKNGESKQKRMTRLLLFLQNQTYANLYHQVEHKLQKAQRAVDKTLEQLSDQIALAEELLETIKDKAPELPDGKKVFRTEDGMKAFREDGTELSKTEMLSIPWTDSNPSWEYFETKRQAYDKPVQEKHNVENYRQQALTPISDRINDPENPLSENELNGFLQNMDEEMTASVKENFDQDFFHDKKPTVSSAAQSYTGDSGMNVPDMNAHFNTARLDVPELEPVGPAVTLDPKP